MGRRIHLYIGGGTITAFIISAVAWKSFWWAFFHSFFGWFYVVYFIIKHYDIWTSWWPF
jgi:hypothetical protein